MGIENQSFFYRFFLGYNATIYWKTQNKQLTKNVPRAITRYTNARNKVYAIIKHVFAFKTSVRSQLTVNVGTRKKPDMLVFTAFGK